MVPWSDSGTKVFLRAAASPDSKSQDNSGVPRACGGSMVNGVSITSGRSSRCAAWKQNWDSLLVGLTWMLLLTSWTRVPRLFR
mmetsp:Transcript_51865/g.107899  ORF Transcript_51865/g.107899 Transcript_51865/m.107899 type:complete len:83 (+) Transcript_51865:474-722(+)